MMEGKIIYHSIPFHMILPPAILPESNVSCFQRLFRVGEIEAIWIRVSPEGPKKSPRFVKI